MEESPPEQSKERASGTASASIRRGSARCPNTAAASTSGAWRMSSKGENQGVILARFMASPDYSWAPGRNLCMSLRSQAVLSLERSRAEIHLCSRERFFVGTRKTDDGDRSRGHGGPESPPPDSA